MQQATQNDGMANAARLVNPQHERIVDRIYLFLFAAMLVLMSIGYLCLCGFLFWVFF